MANRMVDSARSILNSYLPDVYIYTDVARGGGKDRYIQCLTNYYQSSNSPCKMYNTFYPVNFSSGHSTYTKYVCTSVFRKADFSGGHLAMVVTTTDHNTAGILPSREF